MASDDVAFETAVRVPSQRELELQTLPLAVAAFPNKAGNVLMKALGSVAPLADLKHLKRVRKAPEDASLLEAILCTLDDDDDDGAPCSGVASTDACPADPSTSADLAPGRLPEALQALYAQHGGQRLRLVRGAAVAPQTRQQWDAWTKLWPITWRIPDHGTPVTEETPVDAPTQQYFERHMRAALRLASQAGVDNAAVLVDPEAAQAPVAEAADRSAVHPLRHAVMAVVQAASERDLEQWPSEADGAPQGAAGGGAGDALAEGAVEAGAEAGPERLQHGESGDPAAVSARPTHGSIAGSFGGAAVGPSGAGPDDEELASKRPRLGAGPEEAARDAAAPAASRPYMCTGYDCFVVREPCIMCAMALVHSRVQRVIYCRPDAAYGALGGCRRLHACKSLNHNYEVYRLELKRPT
ncbi:hypothetical protein PLESTB_001252400 [Pleodorina starrii]|uniref:CMP/dCMP-type deaminase domain-containing protein n=1 Tax=Pleodorina starrii TaxID=330485 RepID=A0A9W6F629_9CHLO|nr:hypothetical protein PLESTM_000207500 [Pleodorina starrii]GLC57674.1 hypothetical protein PLESTB_001252400 [Pleodorina starrii]